MPLEARLYSHCLKNGGEGAEGLLGRGKVKGGDRSHPWMSVCSFWLRGVDLNHRPLGYDEGVSGLKDKGWAMG